MCSGRWDIQRDAWLYRVLPEDLVECIFRYAVEVPGDTETILWLSSRGVKGSDAGNKITKRVAQQYGNYVPRNEDHYGCRHED